MSRAKRAAQWVVGVGAGTVWAARRLLRTSTFFDEWTLIEQALRTSPWDAAWSSFNGHLWMLQDLVYRSQLLLGGVDWRWPVLALQLVALMGLHVGLARLAERAGVPLAVGLLVGLAAVYMGFAPQNWVFVVQWAGVASMALAVTACAVVLGGPPGRRRSMAVSLLVVGAVLVESGTGMVAVAMVAGVAVVRWRRSAAAALLPGALVAMAWYLLADLGPRFPSSLGHQVRFGLALLARAAGGLVGLGPVPGAVLCGAIAAGAVRVMSGGRSNAADRALVVGGVAGALVAAAAIARARAGIRGFDFADSNRYLFPVAVPLAIALMPLLRLLVEWIAANRRRVVAPRAVWVTVGLVLAAGLVAGQRFEARWSHYFIAANESVRVGVRSTATLLRDGCPGGAVPDPAARPMGTLSPQVTVRLVAELVDRGLLEVDAAATADPATTAAICP